MATKGSWARRISLGGVPYWLVSGTVHTLLLLIATLFIWTHRLPEKPLHGAELRTLELPLPPPPEAYYRYMRIYRNR